MTAELPVPIDLAQIDVRAAPELLPFAAPGENAASAWNDRDVLWLGPDEWLVVAALETAPTIVRELEDALSGRHRSLLDVSGEALVVSQFTLTADTAKGTRPSFSAAAAPEDAEPLYEQFCEGLRELGVRVEAGVFRARMQVELVNDGPVTIVLDV